MLFSPVFIYFIIWVFILFLYSLKIVIFPQLSRGFYLVMIMNVLGLVIGTFQAKLLVGETNKNQVLKNTEDFFNWLLNKKLTLKRIYNILMIISLVGVLTIYLKVFSQVSILQFFIQQQFVKAHVIRSVFGTYLSMAAYVALPIAACLDYITKKRMKFSVIPFVFASMYSLSYWGRFPLLMAVVILLTSKMLFFILNKQIKDFLRYKKGTLTKLFFYGFIAFLLVFLFMSWTIEWRVSEYGVGYDPYAGYCNENVITNLLKRVSYLFGSFRAITLTYSYFVASIPTLNYWANLESEYGLGQASVPYMYRFLAKIGLIDNPILMGDRVVGRGLQLPSFVGYLYIDFGFIGVLILSYLLGLIGTYTYEKFLVKPTLAKIMNLTLIYMIVVFSPITNVIAQTMFVIILFGYFVVNSILKRSFKYRKLDSIIKIQHYRGANNDGKA